jgi:hypothetical protein
MNLIRFIGMLFVFIGVVTSCALAVALLVLMLNYWPLLLAVTLALVVFQIFTSRVGIRFSY